MSFLTTLLSNIFLGILRDLFKKEVEVSETDGVLDSGPVEPEWLQDAYNIRVDED